ncbi:MAG TPA: hypothetical protein VFZ66_28340 [Herpetosiphonaceae bacterium]
MSDIPFGDLIALIFRELSETLDQTAERAELLKLHVSDVNLDIPAHLRLQDDPAGTAETRRLMVMLPTARETPPVGRLGRIRITIAPNSPAEESP